MILCAQSDELFVLILDAMFVFLQWGSKTHSSDVYSLVGEILHDIKNHEEDYISKDPHFVLKIAEAAITSLTDNFENMERKVSGGQRA